MRYFCNFSSKMPKSPNLFPITWKLNRKIKITNVYHSYLYCKPNNNSAIAAFLQLYIYILRYILKLWFLIVQCARLKLMAPGPPQTDTKTQRHRAKQDAKERRIEGRLVAADLRRAPFQRAASTPAPGWPTSPRSSGLCSSSSRTPATEGTPPLPPQDDDMIQRR